MIAFDVRLPSASQADIMVAADAWFAELQGNNDQQEPDDERCSISYLIDKLFPAAKRRSKTNIVLDLVVEKPSWKQTLKNKFPQTSKELEMLVYKARERGLRGAAWVQRRRVIQHLSKISKSQRAYLRKKNSVAKTESSQTPNDATIIFFCQQRYKWVLVSSWFRDHQWRFHSKCKHWSQPSSGIASIFPICCG